MQDYLFNTLQRIQGYNIIQEKIFCLTGQTGKKGISFLHQLFESAKRGRRQGKHPSQVVSQQALMQLGL